MATRLGVLLVAVPPWQNPDEPSHVLGVRILVQRPDVDLSAYYDDLDIEREILASMTAHRWWSLLNAHPPASLESFGTAHPLTGNFGAPQGAKFYYRSLAAAFRSLDLRDLLAQLYAMRAISSVLALLAVGVGTWAAWRAFGPLVGALSGAGVASLPQFALVATTASPDALVCLLGAVVFAAGVVAWETGGAREGAASAAIAVTAAFLALSVRRVGAPLVLIALAAVARAARRLPRRAAVVLATAVGAGLLAVLAGAGSELVRGLTHASEFFSAPPAGPGGPGQWRPFAVGVWRSAWLAPGWLSVAVPAAWHASVLVVSVIALAGLLARIDARGAGGPVSFALLAVVVQMVAVYWAYRGVGLAQGRYLFPALFPYLVLQATGLAAWGGERRWGLCALGPPLVLAALDTVALVGVIIPAFLG